MISNKFILVTGGSSGIGKHLAGELLKNGNQLAIAANDELSLEQATKELSVISSSIYSYSVDVGDTSSVQVMRDKVIRNQGCPDILVNCAGFTSYRTFEDSPIEEIERIVSVNFLGALRCTHSFLPHFIARRTGIIVNIASIAGKLVMTPNGIYSASKHGLVAWSEALGYELSRFNIDVLTICPGRVETAFFDHETFKTRAPRAETQLTIPIERVSGRIISAIEKRKKLSYIPFYYAFIIWAINTFPFVKPLYGRLLSNRVEDLYR